MRACRRRRRPAVGLLSQLGQRDAGGGRESLACDEKSDMQSGSRRPIRGDRHDYGEKRTNIRIGTARENHFAHPKGQSAKEVHEVSGGWLEDSLSQLTR